MPRICSFYGIAIYMYYRDHAPPHFHAIYAGYEAVVAINSTQLLRGALPKRATMFVRDWAIIHRTELAENWERAQCGEPLHPIASLE